MNKLLLGIFIFIISNAVFAQKPTNEIYMGLKKLNVLGSVLYIAAHPDDENNTLLPYLAKEKMYRTGYLSLTRGDGGQNLIGSEQGIELGLIRTQELLAARMVDGCEQYFTRAYEFGFSKSADETLKIWDREKVLSDIVWVIRNYKPDVIIARFPPDKRAGHGHHAASAILANEAFFAAADATKFPEQLSNTIKPWQAKRIVWNTYNFGSNNTTASNQLKFEVGNYNALLGESYGEIGGEARTMHKSQGEGRPRRKGSITEYFSLTAGDSMQTSLMDGVATTWSDFAGGATVEQQINTIIQQYNFEQPNLSIPALVSLYKTLQGLQNENKWVKQKIKEVQQLIVDCAGLFMEATTDTEYAVQGEKLNVSFLVNSRLATQVKLQQVQLVTDFRSVVDTNFTIVLSTNKNITFNKSVLVDANKKVHQPYWLNAPMINGSMFTVNDTTQIGAAENEPSYMAKFIFSIDDISFTYQSALQYKYIDATRGEVLQPVIVVPPVIVSLSPDIVLTNISPQTAKAKNQSIQIQYKSNFTGEKVATVFFIKQGDNIVYKKDTLLNFEVEKSYNLDLPLSKIFNKKLEENLTVEMLLQKDGEAKTYSHFLRKISYDHIPNLHYFYEDNIRVITDSIQVKGKKIGYVIGAGDKVPEALLSMGFEVVYLQEKDITLQNLHQYDAVVTGIRAFNIHDWLTSKNDILNAYVQGGGNLIVQYLKSNTVGSQKVKVGPYNFTVNAQSRVTEENAAVNFLLPKHSVLNYPNKISSKDFKNWVQERSTYQAINFDKNYEAILSMNDEGEQPANGSLIIAKYGKGNFVYSSLVLFRQLPQGIAGAFKLLANMIALPKNKL
jgi:LmbE family N-acetylglucosaminyl deacetylase